MDEKKQQSCSFCGRPALENFKLIAGHNAYICADCAELCHKIFEDKKERLKKGQNHPTWMI